MRCSPQGPGRGAELDHEKNRGVLSPCRCYSLMIVIPGRTSSVPCASADGLLLVEIPKKLLDCERKRVATLTCALSEGKPVVFVQKLGIEPAISAKHSVALRCPSSESGQCP